MKQEQDFKTFYFKDGFESLVPLVNFLETQFKVECGIGSNFINVYMDNDRIGMSAILKRIERAIRRWNAVAPHVELDPREHGGAT